MTWLIAPAGYPNGEEMYTEKSTSARPARIAYLTGEYPKVSHTFIQREISAVRDQGAEVLACTIRRAPDRDVVGEQQRIEAEGTFCVLEEARKPHRLIWAHLSVFLDSPRRWLSALRLAWATRSPGARACLWQFFYFLEAAVLAQHLRNNGVAHLHNHFGDSSCSVAMLTSEMSGIPFSFTLHGPAIFYEARRWRLDAKIERASFVACISHFARSQAMYFSNPSSWAKLKIIHCGVIPANYGRRIRESYGQNVIFIGRLDPVKGVPILLQAFAAVRKEHPGARLTLIGDGPARAALEEQVRALELAEVTTFLGYQTQDEVASLLETADILVLPSFAEGLPVVLMEAMASRLPVITSAIAGIPELVIDGVSGFTVPPGDLEMLSDRLGRLLAAPDRCALMGSAGRQEVEVAFDASRQGEKLARLFLGNE